jgi:hypothetical protein
VRRGNLLFGLFIAAALLIGIGLPLLVHASGGTRVGGWQSFVSPGPLSKAHQGIGSQCTACHTPHVGVEARNCIACHADTDFGSKQSTQFHARATQCTSCHVEHDGGRSLTRMNHDALLVSRFWTGRTGPAGTPARVRQSARDPSARLDCASCHSVRDPHQGLFGRTCSSCHVFDSWEVAAFRHPSVNSTQCSQCHQAPPSHYMMHFQMVSQRVAGQRARVEQCYACHTTDSWNNIRGKGFYDHH